MEGDEVSFEALGRAFVDAFNRRDAEALIALTDPDVAFRPSALAGARRVYRGHEGIREWVADLVASGTDHVGRVHEVRTLDAERFIILSDVWKGGTPVTPSAMLARVLEGRVVEARSYLSSERMLRDAGVIPPADADVII